MPHQFTSLMYHNVIRDDDAGAGADRDGLGPSITSYSVGPEAFSRHLDTILSVADVLTHAELQRFYLATELPQPAAGRPLVQLTFDDGWRGTVDVAGPLLADRGVQALAFVTTGLIGSRHFLTANALAHLPAASFHVGSHTVSHRFLNELPDQEIRSELLDSRRTLEDIVGYAVDAVSIPNGAADARVVRIAAECGYRFICVSDVHVNTRQRGPLAIGRVAIRATTTIDAVHRYAHGELGRERLRSTLLSLPKRFLGAERYRRARAWALGQSVECGEMSDLIEERHGAARAVAASDAIEPSPHCGPRTGAMRCNGG